MMDVGIILQQIKENPLLDGITLSGGEPLEQAEELVELAAKVKEMKLSVIIYTGYTYEQIIENSENRPGWKRLLQYTDILVDGPFIQELADPLLPFRGSSNQRVINLKLVDSASGI